MHQVRRNLDVAPRSPPRGVLAQIPASSLRSASVAASSVAAPSVAAPERTFVGGSHPDDAVGMSYDIVTDKIQGCSNTVVCVGLYNDLKRAGNVEKYKEVQSLTKFMESLRR